MCSINKFKMDYFQLTPPIGFARILLLHLLVLLFVLLDLKITELQVYLRFTFNSL